MPRSRHTPLVCTLASLLILQCPCQADELASSESIRILIRPTPGFADRIPIQPAKFTPRGGWRSTHVREDGGIWQKLVQSSNPLPHVAQNATDKGHASGTKKDSLPKAIAKNTQEVVVRGLDYEGYSIALWDSVIQQINKLRISNNQPTLTSTVVGVVDSMEEMIARLADGTADVGLGAISVTEDRMKQVDFSFPIYESSYQIMVPADRAPADFASLLVPFRQLLKLENMTWILLLLGSLLLISHLVWVAERRINARVFPDQYHRGIGETVWWSLSTLMSGGCEEKPVQGRAGRFVALIWMFGALMFATFVQSTVTTSMVTSGGSSFQGLESFKPSTTTIGLLHKSAAWYWLRNQAPQQNIPIPRTMSWEHREQVIDALRSGQIDGWLHDSPILHRYASKDPKLKVLGGIHGSHNYAFMFRKDFPFGSDVDAILVRLKSSGTFDRLEQEYIGNIAKTKS